MYTNETATLCVIDDGKGFNPTNNSEEGFGLQSMQERLIKLGGHVNVESEPGVGTTITGFIPLTNPEQKEDQRSWLPWANQ
ncbi:MAG: ATP-binding protein, partial [Actinomycetota bacterium]|nr:ATP-binding protein [Actinomycetota bacterium]